MKKTPFSHLKSAAKANEPSTRHRLITRGEERACQLILGVILIVGIAVLASLTGCSHSQVGHYLPPSSASTRAAITEAKSSITAARSDIAEAQSVAAALRASIPAALFPKFSDLTNRISSADADMTAAASNTTLALTNLASYENAVTNQTAALNQTSARLDYLEPKYQKAVALIWKWRLIALGVIAGIIAYLTFKYGRRLAAWAATLAAKIP